MALFANYAILRFQNVAWVLPNVEHCYAFKEISVEIAQEVHKVKGEDGGSATANSGVNFSETREIPQRKPESNSNNRLNCRIHCPR